jgi:sterol desaturase/sphingolipid hydroxylase (fatty acid hydroxylase superfamily)
MHLWHHAEYIPQKRYGVNYGISLSLWDFIFRTAYMKKDNRDIILGFKNMDKFPSGFLGQFLYPLFRKD